MEIQEFIDSKFSLFESIVLWRHEFVSSDILLKQIWDRLHAYQWPPFLQDKVDNCYSRGCRAELLLRSPILQEGSG